MYSDLINLFYPSYCYSCNNILSINQKYFCLSCFEKIPFFDNSNPINNSIHLTLFNKLPLNEAFSLLEYRKNSSIQELLHDLKYAKQKDIAAYFGKLLGVQIKKFSTGNFPDFIIPVPMHADKLKARGYNQAELIAQSISEILNIEVLTKGIEKTKKTQTQTHLNRLQRWYNAEEVFKVTLDLNYKHVLLVDDVITTGATLEALGKECINAGAARISVATLATAI